MKRALPTALLVVLAGAGARAQERVRVALRVTAVAGDSVFLDRGRTAGLVPGTRVRLEPPGGVPIEAIVRSVSNDSARAELPPGVPPPPVGTPGECEIEPAPQPSEHAPRRATERVPEHPPWPDQGAGFDPEGPLLARAQGTAPEDRPVQWHGRTFASLNASRDRGGGAQSDWFVGRAGARLDAQNLLGEGGRFEAAFDADRRSTDLLDTGSESDSRLRLERFAYVFGDPASAPARVHVGRFFSEFLPELGLLDGVEGARRLDDGYTVGAFAGALPLPFPAHASGEDIGLHAFVDQRSERTQWTLGAQTTWHRGAPDRDQVLGRLALRPTDELSLWASARADIYTSSDQLKGSGVELTQSYATLRYAQRAGFGASLAHSHFEWPEMDRREFANTSPDLIANGRVDRITAQAWGPLATGFRVTGRADAWDDHAGSGLGWEVRADLDGVVAEDLLLSLAVFQLDGTFTSGPGFRLEGRRHFAVIDAWLAYETREYEQNGLANGSESFTSQSIRGGLSWWTGGWNVDLTGDVFFGDGEEALAIGLFGQYSF